MSCEKCQRRYVYELERSGVTAYHLRRLLAEEVEAVPCPECGWYQSGMLAAARKRHCRWMLHLGQCLTIGIVPVALIGLIANGYPQLEAAPAIPWPLFALALICWLATGVGMFVWRHRRIKDFNPNKGDTEARKQYGRSRALPEPETLPHGITADIGPDVRFTCEPNLSGITGHVEPGTPASEPGVSELPVTASSPPAAPADNPLVGIRAALGWQEASKAILGGIAGLLLIVGCVYYWLAEKDREAKKEVDRAVKCMEEVRQKAFEQRIQREGPKLPAELPLFRPPER